MTKEELDNQLRTLGAILHMLLEINDAVGDALEATDKLISRVQNARAKASQELK
jgi:uncharacterized spore protein YtfJ